MRHIPPFDKIQSMTMTSIHFLFAFLPLILLAHRFAGRRLRLLILLAASLLFCWLAGGKGMILLAGTAVFTWLAGLCISTVRSRAGKTALLIIAVSAELALLVFFKYRSALLSMLPASGLLALTEDLVPLGMSFYIFQSVSYLIDIRNGEAVLKNPVHFGVYLTFFPKLLSGPLVRLREFRSELEGKTASRTDLYEGFSRFLTGLCKKVILADQLHHLASVTDVYAHTDMTTVSCLWLTTAAYSLELYFDFAGYTDMAIGLGRMFGMRLPENFRDPYCCRTLTDFWRRWHISLSRWFRDYVYIPLGGSRNGSVRTVINLLIVWILTGLWHGSTICYLFWGLGHFLVLVLEKFVIRPERFASGAARVFYRIFTLVWINLMWIFFPVQSPADALQIFRGLFGLGGLPLFGPQTVYFLQNNGLLLLICFVLASPLASRVRNPRTKTGSRLAAILWFAGVILAVSFVVRGAYNPFVYQIF